MPTPTCLVRSSINIDETFQVPHIVRAGETISSSRMDARAGGKGANVAAALGLAGARVRMLGAVGDDATWPLDLLAEHHVDVESVHRSSDAPTGRAFIQIAADGENSIVLLKGANFERVPALDDPQQWLAQGVSHLVLQNEIPLEVTAAYVRCAEAVRTDAARICTIFNPSPMLGKDELRAFPWTGVDVLVVNEGEAHDLVVALHGEAADQPSPAHTLAGLSSLSNTPWLVMTRGGRGVLAGVLLEGTRTWLDLPASAPRAVVNTTGAGDTFTGYLVAGLMKEEPQTRAAAENVLRAAGLAACMAVEVDGAMESIPAVAAVQARQGGGK
ncbi:ribokinase [Malassezia sp. CBS 17886]|nr:ribokinase [Malassezia sp. CBS 17886]